MIIEWRFGKEGLPTSELGEMMQGFEAHLDRLDDHTGNALLVHVYTGSGMREWCYYVKRYERFMADFNAALTGKPRFPIQIVHDHDSVWKYQAGIKMAAEGNV